MPNQNVNKDNKRIAKNMIMLYCRMILVMGVTLYTSRVVLDVLGEIDYGIYNVVGGVIIMLAFINTSMSGASARFITYEIGKGSEDEVARILSVIKSIHYILALVVLLIAETLGLWFVMTKLVIPPDRLIASFWVYQASVLSMVIIIVSIPYNALIIAHEKMSAFAYISILEVGLKLIITFVLYLTDNDKLILYAFLLVAVQSVVRFAYLIYCKKQFTESNVKPVWDTTKVKEISSYVGWSLNGHIAVVGYTQGINILLNLFFGPSVNAARGIAVQVQGAIQSLVGNFQTAIRPQIVKSFAGGDLQHMHKLVIAGSKFGFYLMLIVAVPIFVLTPNLLKIWLVHVPKETVSFIRILMIIAMLEPLKGSLISAVHATGDIKRFQLYEGGILLSIVPVSYIMLKFLSITAAQVFIILLVIELITQAVRIKITLSKISMTFKFYFDNVILPIAKVLPLVIFVMATVSVDDTNNLLYLGTILFFIFTICIADIFIIGLSATERKHITNLISNKLRTLFRRIMKSRCTA